MPRGHSFVFRCMWGGCTGFDFPWLKNCSLPCRPTKSMVFFASDPARKKLIVFGTNHGKSAAAVTTKPDTKANTSSSRVALRYRELPRPTIISTKENRTSIPYSNHVQPRISSHGNLPDGPLLLLPGGASSHNGGGCCCPPTNNETFLFQSRRRQNSGPITNTNNHTFRQQQQGIRGQVPGQAEHSKTATPDPIGGRNVPSRVSTSQWCVSFIIIYFWLFVWTAIPFNVWAFIRHIYLVHDPCLGGTFMQRICSVLLNVLFLLHFFAFFFLFSIYDSQQQRKKTNQIPYDPHPI